MNAHSRTIIKRLGGDAISAKLDVKARAIRRAAREGIPGDWYKTILDMCHDAGEPCRLDAFRWREDFIDKSTSEQTAPRNEGVEL